MRNRGKKNTFEKEVKMENTEVWVCESCDCKGWMRKQFSFSEEPNCPLCGSSMATDTKELPVLESFF
ncbi:MAG: cold-inducible protein YdjO-related protein [Bacillaceae bacterium]